MSDDRRDARPVDAVVLGGSGYVGGELLRLLAGHPVLRVAAVASASSPGTPVAAQFPHLSGTSVAALRFTPVDEVPQLFARGKPTALFAALPHGATAEPLDRLLRAADANGADLRAVDLSADFRFADPVRYQAIYGKPHGAPARLAQFVCTVPELHRGPLPRHAAQPGCFTTSVVLGAAPFLAGGFARPEVFVAAVTGSSGSGRVPGPGTHHPERRSDLRAYNALSHRHEQEMRLLLGRVSPGGNEPEVEFVPHSGPFVRGIHATLKLTLTAPHTAAGLVAAARDFYGDGFVEVAEEPARLAAVVGTNRCRLGLAVRGSTLVVTSVLDNLVKGAAGGAIQWMNRLCGLPDATGLSIPGLGWF